jgi:hypothetical protein
LAGKARSCFWSGLTCPSLNLPIPLTFVFLLFYISFHLFNPILSSVYTYIHATYIYIHTHNAHTYHYVCKPYICISKLPHLFYHK